MKRKKDLANLVLFVGDDLRESALAVAAIEAFLCEAQQALARPELEGAELQRLLDDDRPARLELLADALQSLERSLRQILAAHNSK